MPGPKSWISNAISIKSLKRLCYVFLDRFIASFDAPPRHLTLDLDAVDDPAPGHRRSGGLAAKGLNYLGEVII
jgi:hypothetical protein